MSAAWERARAADQESNEWDLSSHADLDLSLGDWAYADAGGSVPTAAEPQQCQQQPMTKTTDSDHSESSAVLFISGGDPISDTLSNYMHADELQVIEYSTLLGHEAVNELLDDYLWSQAQGNIIGAGLKGMIISLDLQTFTDEFRPELHPMGAASLRGSSKERVRKENVLLLRFHWLLDHALNMDLPVLLLLHVNGDAEHDFTDMEEFVVIRSKLFRYAGALSSSSYRLYCNFEPIFRDTAAFATIIQGAYEEVVYGSSLPRLSYHQHLRRRLQEVQATNKGLDIADGIRKQVQTGLHSL